MIDAVMLSNWNINLEIIKKTESSIFEVKPEWLVHVKDLMYVPVSLYKGNVIVAATRRFKTEKEVDDFFGLEVPNLEEHLSLYCILKTDITGPNDFCPRAEYVVRYALTHPKDFKSVTQEESDLHKPKESAESCKNNKVEDVTKEQWMESYQGLKNIGVVDIVDIKPEWLLAVSGFLISPTGSFKGVECAANTNAFDTIEEVDEFFNFHLTSAVDLILYCVHMTGDKYVIRCDQLDKSRFAAPISTLISSCVAEMSSFDNNPIIFADISDFGKQIKTLRDNAWKDVPFNERFVLIDPQTGKPTQLPTIDWSVPIKTELTANILSDSVIKYKELQLQYPEFDVSDEINSALQSLHELGATGILEEKVKQYNYNKFKTDIIKILDNKLITTGESLISNISRLISGG